LGCGNDARTDDGLGIQAIDWLEGEAPRHSDWPALHLVAIQQLQIEYVLDLAGSRLVLFVDAAPGIACPYQLSSMAGVQAVSWSTHSLDPAGVVAVYQKVIGTPPPCFQLAIRGDVFDMGVGLSSAAAVNLGLATTLIGQLLERPDSASWLALCGRMPI
jgi:hydrogenase maturation protease